MEAEDRSQLLQGCVAASAAAATTIAIDSDKLNAVVETARLALSNATAAMQQRSKQRTAVARQQQVQEQLEQRQQLAQGIKQLKERGLQVLRAGLAVPASTAGSSARQPQTAGLQKGGVLQALSAEQVAAGIASRAERLKARLAAASLIVQEAAAPSAATSRPDVSTAAAGSNEGGWDAGVGRGGDGGSCVTPSLSSNEDEAAFLQEQRKRSTAQGLQGQVMDSSAAAYEAKAAGSDSSMDSDLESLVAGMLKPSLLPDWTRRSAE
jgi:hypothetical protein